MAIGARPAGFRTPRTGVQLAPVAHFVGTIICGLGAFMILPALVDLSQGNKDFRAFIGAAAIAVFAGMVLILGNRHANLEIGSRESILAVLLTWVGATAFGALPFILATQPHGITDSLFETISGLTATGSSVFTGLDTAPAGILLWRFILIWLGGFGLVTFATLALPYLRVGGLQLFMLDLSARPGKFVPKTTQVVAQIGLVYVALTAACGTCFYLAGMSGFDAMGHAMSAVATGGFSSHDAGIGYFKSPAIEWIATGFMVASAMPFALYLHVMHGRPGTLLRDSQVRLFLVVIGGAVLLMTLWRVRTGHVPPMQGLREAAFNVASIISTTGFTSQDFGQWGGFVLLLLLCLMLLGGCTGSTAGGIKMFRLWILIQALVAQVRRQLYPSGVFSLTYNAQPVPQPVLGGVVVYFFLYMLTFTLLALGLSLTGLSLPESLGGAATTLGGVGPGFGRIGPCCTFADVPEVGKWLLMLGMLAGRLEILLLVMPFTRMFWRD
jgi:trk system potassium uptake protein TrkH